jgi:hypothetical protein
MYGSSNSRDKKESYVSENPTEDRYPLHHNLLHNTHPVTPKIKDNN